MDLLACAQCEHRFYAPGAGGSYGRRCPHCGGGLALDVQGVASIPLDAHWLDPGAVPANVTVVQLRRKRKRDGKGGKRIVRDLADYFPIKSNGRSVEVSVNRGAAADAALRVAAVLDGVDGGWEEHFYLPTNDPEAPPDHRLSPRAPYRAHLHLVGGTDRNASPGRLA